MVVMQRLAFQHVGFTGPGIESVSPALAGGFLDTAPPGNSQKCIYFMSLFQHAHAFLYLFNIWKRF